ncbi:MAG: 16S rRNA (guanine(966)-N(2))-methyltransferase RsmD [Longimicrobiales bacterium]
MRIIAGRWRGHGIRAPRGMDTRPTTDRVREAWFSALQPALGGARVLDLYAGSGALGLEALSRGAAHVTFVERSAGALRALRENIEKLGAAGQAEIIREDVLRYLPALRPGAFDIALADPPYGTGQAATLARLYQRTPFADSLWIEHSMREPLADADVARSRRYGDTLLTTLTAAS